jgi:hypothetical protein
MAIRTSTCSIPIGSPDYLPLQDVFDGIGCALGRGSSIFSNLLGGLLQQGPTRHEGAVFGSVGFDVSTELICLRSSALPKRRRLRLRI